MISDKEFKADLRSLAAAVDRGRISVSSAAIAMGIGRSTLVNWIHRESVPREQSRRKLRSYVERLGLKSDDLIDKLREKIDAFTVRVVKHALECDGLDCLTCDLARKIYK